MIALPGLNLAAPPTETLNVPAASLTREQDLPAKTEYRFEVSFSRTLTVRLRSGTAEYFGTELAPSTTYSFQGTKGAIYTWHGCKLELGGQVESDYVAEETPMVSHANVHFALEALRERSAAGNGADMGPRVLVVGAENAGKTALVKTLTSYAVKSGRQPMVINLDPRQGMLTVPGSFSAAAFSSIVDVEEGWGSSPISGPSPIPVKMPLVYHYGLHDPEEGKLFKPLVTRMALAVTSRLEEDRASRHAGFIIDTSGSISAGRSGVYDNIEHIVSEFSVNILITLGSERLYSDLTKKFSSSRPGDEPVTVLRIDKSGGCVDRSASYMVALRHAQIREYFFGHGEDALAPSSTTADYSELCIFQTTQTDSPSAPTDYNPLSLTSRELYTRVPPSAALANKLLAITAASPNDKHEVIRDSSVRGYVYVADVDEAKRKVRLLSPQPGRLPGSAMVLGRWPEDVAGLVS